MADYSESTGIYTKEWATSQGILKLEVNFKTNEIHIILKNGTKISEIPLSSLNGIPKEAFNDAQKLAAFLNNSYVKLSSYNDGSYKIQINQKLLGGGNIETDPARLWPNATVPYFIDPSYPQAQRKIVEDAIAAWQQANTGFIFISATKKHPNGPVIYNGTTYENYIEFSWNADLSSCSIKEKEEKTCSVCESHVGKQGGRQLINCDLSGQYDMGSIMHEIGHALGLYHEHQREDRGKFVTISKDGNADKANYGIEGKSFGKYDFESIMHYHFFEYHTKKIKEIDMTENEELFIREEEVEEPDFENPKMRINHNLPGDQYDQIIKLNSVPNEYGEGRIPSEKLKDKHKHLIANNPYSLYQLESGVLSVGAQQYLSDGDIAAAKHLADLGKRLIHRQPQQPAGNSPSSSYRPGRGRGY